MMIEFDDGRLSRYDRRIQEEKAAAEAAKTEEAKLIHMHLLAQYERMAAALRTK